MFEMEDLEDDDLDFFEKKMSKDLGMSCAHRRTSWELARAMQAGFRTRCGRRNRAAVPESLGSAS